MKERKLSKESLLKKFRRMHGRFGDSAVETIKDFDVERIRRIVNVAEMMRVNISSNKKDLDYSDFKKFPTRVQKEIISVLGVYNKCHVNFEFGKWDVTPDICLRAYYGKDHRVFGTFEYDNLVNKVKGLKEAREKYEADFSKINVSDSFWN